MPKHIIFLFGGAIGDALLGVQLLHTLEAARFDGRVTFLSTRKSSFVRQFLELVPHAIYEELSRENVHSWFKLFTLAFSPHGIVFLEPFLGAVPLWWKVIARAATFFPGSREVHCQSRPQKVPARVQIISYDPRTDSLFSMIGRVVPLLTGQSPTIPTPYLTIPSCPPSRLKNPYILFHFFAGSYRRSFPLEKVRPLLIRARSEFPSYTFILTCAHPEEAAAREMAAGITDVQVEVSPPAAALLCLLKESSLCVGVASGVTHIASHLQVPSVVMCNLSDPCWLPTYAKTTIQLAAREQCGCHGDKTGECGVQTPGGLVYRCLYDIKTERVIEAMKNIVAPTS